MNPSQAKLIAQLSNTFHPSWLSIALWGVLICILIYVRYVQVQTRKMRQTRRAERNLKNEELQKTLALRDRQLLEMVEQFSALEDILQSTQEQMELLNINGEIDQQVLELLYHATTHSSEVSSVE